MKAREKKIFSLSASCLSLSHFTPRKEKQKKKKKKQLKNKMAATLALAAAAAAAHPLVTALLSSLALVSCSYC